MKNLMDGRTPEEAAEFIQSLGGLSLDLAVQTHLDRPMIVESEMDLNPSQSLKGAWLWADCNNQEQFHKFNLHCDAGLWECCFSSMFYSCCFCKTPQQSILQALLMEKCNLTRNVYGDELKWEIVK